jgi:hypothetical protein
LYIARVLDDYGKIPDDDYEGIEEIEEALIRAHNQNVIILAVASNEGDLNEVAFPTRLRDFVICIDAATGHGAIRDFTANDSNFQHYAALGIAVRGASLKDLWYRSNPTEIRRGTSTATPIAAGIAALLIDFARRNDCKLKSHKAMLKLFAKFSRPKDTYRVLASQQLSNDPTILKKIIEDALATGNPSNELF